MNMILIGLGNILIRDMGGDSDTLACITGGIAEAFYGEIPEEMILETKRVFPQIFHKILDAMKINTAYGKQNI